MPRIYTSASDPLDFCMRCFPDEIEAKAQYGNVGDGPDERGNCFGWDCAHPDYAAEDYRCHKCNKRLKEIDNGDGM